MKWIVLLGCVSLAATLLAAEETTVSGSEPTVHTAGSLRWADAPPRLPAGGKMTVLDGNPAEAGTFIVRLKMPAGYKIMPHTHPVAERVTVISGALHIGTGDKPGASAGRILSPGDFVVFPKGNKHSAWTTEETVIQIQSEGPFDMQYVDPADDPRKK